MRSTPGLSAPTALVVLALVTPPAAAAWPVDGLVLPAAPGGTAATCPGLARDATQGAYVAFGEVDANGARSFRVFRVDENGGPAPGWPAAGLRVGGPTTVSTTLPTVLSDGAGGVLLVWCEFGPPFEGYALRLDAQGAVAPGWPARGALLCRALLDQTPVAAEDGAGGVVVAWKDPAGDVPGVYYQHVLGNGTRASGFPAVGRRLTIAGSPYTKHRWPTLVRDGANGYWLSYTAVSPDAGLAPSQCRVARLQPDAMPDPDQDAGGLVLPVPHAQVFGFVTGMGAPVALAPDGNGGVHAVAWRGADLRGFHLLGTPELDPGWPADGLLLASGLPTPTPMVAPAENWPLAAADGAGGAYVAWGDPADESRAMATRVLPDGSLAPAWAGGRRLDGAMCQSLVADPGGLYAAGYFPLGCPHYSCYGANTLCRFDASGAVASGWPDPGAGLADMPGFRLGEGYPDGAPRLCADGVGGLYATWNAGGATRLQRWLPGGLLDVPSGAPLAFALAGLRFAPDAGVRAAYSLPSGAAATLELFDVAGRRHARERLMPGAGEVTLATTRDLPPGLYFARLAAGPRLAVAKVVVAR